MRKKAQQKYYEKIKKRLWLRKLNMSRKEEKLIQLMQLNYVNTKEEK